MFHKFFLDSPTMCWVDVNNFYRQMWELSNKEVVYLDDYDPNNSKHVVITFDGVYKNVLIYACPILKKFNYPFELFVTQDYIGKNNGFDTVEPNCEFANIDDLIELTKNGGRLQWHTKSHINLKDVTDINILNQELFVDEGLKKLDNNGFGWFAYPYGEYNEKVIEHTKKSFRGGISCIQGNDTDIYKLNRLTVLNNTSFRNEKIGCIIASYNYGQFLVEAIESVLHQTIIPDEILISDDCSIDNTQEIAEIYVRKYPNLIKYNRNNTNIGIVNHFNKAINLIDSEIVFFLGADNRLLSNYVEECSKKILMDSNVGICYTDFALFGQRAKIIYESFPEAWRDGCKHAFYLIKFPIFNLENHSLEKGNYIHGSSLFKKKAFVQAGGYIEKNERPEDYDLFLRMIKNKWIASKADNTYLEYRQHTKDQANIKFASQAELIFYKKHCRQLEAELFIIKKSFIWKFFKPFIILKKILSIVKQDGIIVFLKIVFRKIFK